jgi:type I restriction enzyme S subunit
VSYEAPLPTAWVNCTLGDVVAYGKTQKAEPEQIPDDAWVLELEDIEKDTSKVVKRMTFAERQSKSTKNRFAQGDVLYGKLRPYLNKVVYATEDGYCTTEVIPLTPPTGLDGRYLFHWLKHPTFLEYVASVSHGLNMPRLGTDAGRAAPFVLAPLPEQKRIADKLDTLLARVDTFRNHLARVPAILKRFRQSVLAAATSGELTEDWRNENATPDGLANIEVQRRLDSRRAEQRAGRRFKEPSPPDMTHWTRKELPESWSIESVSAYSDCLDHLRIPVTRSKRATTHGRYPYYGANGQVDMVDDYIFDDELVLVTEDETFYGREKPIAYRTSGPCWVNNHAHVLRAGSLARADYLCFSLMYYDVLPWLTGTTGRAKLTQGVLNSLPVAVPPEAEIDVIVRRVESLFGLADQLEARYTTARTHIDRLTPALLAKAFRGELVPQDPSDAP